MKLLLSLILILCISPVYGANRLKTWIAETLTFANLNSEFDNIYIGTIDRTAGRWGNNDDIPIFLGSSQDARLEWDTTQATDSVILGLGAGRIFSIMELADMTTDWGIASQTNPTLFVHSADATATTDFISLTHNQTNAVIESGSGGIVINDSSADADFRVESDGLDDMIFVDASTNEVGIGTQGTLDGTMHILSNATNQKALIIEMPVSSTTQALQIHYNGTSELDVSLTATQTLMTLGSTRNLGNDIRGPGIVAQRNNGTGAEGDAPGFLLLVQADGGSSYLWAENDATLKIHTAAATGDAGTPTVDENAGTVVGSQTSPEFIKNILYRYPNEPNDRAYEKFQAVLDTPIKDFNFKSGKYKQDFTGIAVPDGEHPWYGQDVVTMKNGNDMAPFGTAKALNEMNMAGYLILSIKVLNKKIERLDNEISRLHSSRTVALR